jgi:hypothetical protein
VNPTPVGSEPHRPGGPLAPTASGTDRQPLTRAQKIVASIVGTGTLFIAGLGFAGSYEAVTAKAHTLGFGWFANWMTIGVDAGIGVFLALDLLLTWLRMPYPLLRHIAWLLTASTIIFNASASWPNALGVGMHAVTPILFVAAVEAARHAVGRIADITADKYMESPPVARWILNPAGTFILWRRQRLWAIREWGTVLELERERRIYIGQLRQKHPGRGWRRKAAPEQLLVLQLATKNGMSISDAIELPAREAEKRRQEADRIAREAQQAADERARQIEADRIARERDALVLEQEKQAAARAQELADAEHKGRIEEIARREQEAADAAQAQRRAQELEHARALAAEQQKAADAARIQREDEEAAARAAQATEAASRRAAEVMQRAANASATATSRPASASRPAATSTANTAANGAPVSASPASAGTATSPARTASANASQPPDTSASAVDIANVVAVYQLLEQQLGKAPSDQRLGDALGVSRSRAQQLRTDAVNAGHTQLAKPLRIAS